MTSISLDFNKNEIDYIKFYNYKENITNDILTWFLKNEIDIKEISFDELYDKLFVSDMVTGNASGSYTFSRFKASLNLVGNFCIIEEMIDQDFIEIKTSDDLKPEKLDVSIRCFLLNECLKDAIEIENKKNGGK